MNNVYWQKSIDPILMPYKWNEEISPYFNHKTLAMVYILKESKSPHQTFWNRNKYFVMYVPHSIIMERSHYLLKEYYTLKKAQELINEIVNGIYELERTSYPHFITSKLSTANFICHDLSTQLTY